MEMFGTQHLGQEMLDLLLFDETMKCSETLCNLLDILGSMVMSAKSQSVYEYSCCIANCSNEYLTCKFFIGVEDWSILCVLTHVCLYDLDFVFCCHIFNV